MSHHITFEIKPTLKTSIDPDIIIKWKKHILMSYDLLIKKFEEQFSDPFEESSDDSDNQSEETKNSDDQFKTEVEKPEDELNKRLQLSSLLIENSDITRFDNTFIDAQEINFPVFQEIIQNIELFKEFFHILSMLDSPQTLEQAFIKRLKERQNNLDVIGFHQNINSKVNQLYLHLAKELFNIHNIQELFTFLLPKTKTILSIVDIENDELEINTASLPATLQIQLARDKATFILEEKSIEKLSKEDMKTMSQDMSAYLIINDIIFDVNAFIGLKLSLRAHATFYDYLTEKYPELAIALYNRNESFRKLKYNIQAMQQASVMSPKEALEHLIKQLFNSGSVKTGKEDADPAGFIALKNFLKYAESLPIDLKYKIYQLNAPSESTPTTIEWVIETHLLKNKECVETAADYLKNILQHNSDKAFLLTRPLLTTDKILELEKLNHKLSAEKEINLLDLPLVSKKEIISKIFINNENEIIDIFAMMPIQLYEDLYNHLNFSYFLDDRAELLNKYIDEGWFNHTQEIALKQAIENSFKLLRDLYIAILNNNIHDFKKTLHTIQEEKRSELLLNPDFSNSRNILQTIFSQNNQEFIQFSFAIIEEIDSDALKVTLLSKIKIYTDSNQNLLSYLLKNEDLWSQFINKNIFPLVERMNISFENIVFFLGYMDFFKTSPERLSFLTHTKNQHSAIINLIYLLPKETLNVTLYSIFQKLTFPDCVRLIQHTQSNEKLNKNNIVHAELTYLLKQKAINESIQDKSYPFYESFLKIIETETIYICHQMSDILRLDNNNAQNATLFLYSLLVDNLKKLSMSFQNVYIFPLTLDINYNPKKELQKVINDNFENIEKLFSNYQNSIFLTQFNNVVSDMVKIFNNGFSTTIHSFFKPETTKTSDIHLSLTLK